MLKSTAAESAMHKWAAAYSFLIAENHLQDQLTQSKAELLDILQLQNDTAQLQEACHTLKRTQQVSTLFNLWLLLLLLLAPVTTLGLQLINKFEGLMALSRRKESGR